MQAITDRKPYGYRETPWTSDPAMAAPPSIHPGTDGGARTDEEHGQVSEHNVGTEAPRARPGMVGRRVGRRIRMTCRGCGATHDIRPGIARLRQKAAAYAPIVIDWDRDAAEYTCYTCSNSARMKTVHQATVKRRGRAALRELGNALAAWRAANPELLRANGKAVGSASRGRPVQRTARQRASFRLGLLRARLSGLLSICAVCHKLTYKTAGRKRLQEAHHAKVIGQFHLSCLREWQGTTEWATWMHACREASRSGAPMPPIPIPPRPSTRLSSGEELAQAYTTTVRYFWQREGNGPAARDENGRVRSIAWLARDLGITRDAIYRRVERFLELLPDEARATSEMKRWREIFLPLAAEEEDGLSNSLHLAQAKR